MKSAPDANVTVGRIER